MRNIVPMVAAAALGAVSPSTGPAWAATAEELTAPGPEGSLAGTLVSPGEQGGAAPPVVLIVPGSGPTDRDGNSPLGVAAAPYRLLAEALAGRGVASLRVDKRGMFASAAAVEDADDVTIDAYAEDVAAWVRVLRDRLGEGRRGRPCVVLLGHSEGGLVVLWAAARVEGLCGVVLAAVPGRPAGAILREQLRARLGEGALLEQALGAVAALERGHRVDAGALDPGLAPLFGAPLQGFLIDLLAHDPAAMAAAVDVPLLVLQGGRDLQLGEVDARRLADAAPDARLVLLPEVNHVLKAVPNDPDANLASYADPNLPLAPGVAAAVAGFVADLDPTGDR